MKVTSFLVLATFCNTAASAFGLNGAAGIAKAVAPKSYAKKPMVQAVDIQGNRANSWVSQVISQIFFTSCLYSYGCNVWIGRCRMSWCCAVYVGG